MHRVIPALLLMLIAASVSADDRTSWHNVKCDGDYPAHLQGVCTNRKDSIYWSFTTVLVKTGRDGKLLKKIPVPNHHGDLCFHDGAIYVAVNLGNFNDPAGNADSWVYVYDPETLELRSKHEVQEVFHGAGGIGVMNGEFYVVGGLPKGVKENYVYQYDSQFRFQRRHIISSGWTNVGIQTVAYHEEIWWFGCYGKPQVLLRTDPDFKLLGRHEFDSSLGIVGVSKDRLLSAKGPRTKENRCLGSLHLVRPDPDRGLVYISDSTSVTD